MEQRAHDSESYLGSWMIVKEILRSHGIRDDLRLFDVSATVAEALKDEPGFSRSDGFIAALSYSNAPDLVLCDPAYSDDREKAWTQAEELARKLAGRAQPALLWYPIYKRKKARSLRDFPAIRAEITDLVPDQAFSREMRGCGMIAFGLAGDAVRAAKKDLAEVAAALDGSFTLHVPRLSPTAA